METMNKHEINKKDSKQLKLSVRK